MFLPRRISERLEFAREAGDYFLKNPEKETYTRGEIEPDCLFAIRWGADRGAAHAVLVLQVAEAEIWGDLDYDRAGRTL